MQQLNRGKISEFAIVSLTIAIMSFLQLAGFEKAILAIIFGVLALKKISSPESQLRGEGMAAAGIVLGIIYCIVAGIAIYNFMKHPELLEQFMRHPIHGQG